MRGGRNERASRVTHLNVDQSQGNHGNGTSRRARRLAFYVALITFRDDGSLTAMQVPLWRLKARMLEKGLRDGLVLEGR